MEKSRFSVCYFMEKEEVMKLFELFQEILTNNTMYHGSRVSGIKVLKPKKHFLYKRKVVYATPDIKFALAMMYGTGDELAVGYFTNTKTNERRMYIDELKPNTLKLLDKPGYLYTVSRKGFKRNKKISDVEYIRFRRVKVVEETKIDNVLKELKKYKNIDFTKYNKVLDAMKKRDKKPPKIKHDKDRFK